MCESTKLINFTDCLLHLVASCINKKSEEILVFMDINKGFLYIICNGIETNYSILEHCIDINVFEKPYFMNHVHFNYELTLSNMINLSEKVTIMTTNNNNQAYKVVFNHGVRSNIAEVIPKKSTCTEIVIEGLLSPQGRSKMRIHEYFVLRGYLSAMALITCSIPINVSDSTFGEVLNWPGKFTGLGSAFSAVIKSEANTILPVYANFKNIRMKAFVGLRLYSNKYLQFIYINKNFVMWKALYKLFNHIIEKSYTKGDNHFTFVLDIECPDSECVICYHYFTIEVRPKNIEAIIKCFCLLQDNIKMLMNCVREAKKDRLSLLPIEDSDHRTKDVSKQQCLALLPNKFDIIHLYSTKCQKSINAYEIQNIVLELNYILQDQDVLDNFLHLNEKLHEFMLNVHLYGKKGYKISVLSIIYEVITYLLSSCNNSNERSNVLRYLVNSFSSLHYKAILEDLTASMEDLFIAKTKKLRKTIDKISGQTEYEAIAYSTTDMHNRNTQYHTNNNLPNSNVVLRILSNHHIVKSSLSLDQQGGFDPGNAVNDKIENVNLYQQFNVVGRNIYIPKGTSPIMEKREKLSLMYESATIQSSSREMFNIMDKNICNNTDLNLFKQLKVSSLSTDIQFISKELFKHTKVIGQLDKKYILCELDLISQEGKIEKNLIVFDQHGVDERVRLENLLIRFADDPEKGNLVRWVMQKYWLVLNCSTEKLNILFQFIDYFFKYGFELKKFSTETLTVTSIPEMLHWLAEYWTMDTSFYYSFLSTTLQNIIEEQLESITKTGHTTNVLPTIIHKYLCKTACSSAIKFGMSLTSSECKAVVNELSKCNIPFMCAHGRPTAFFITKISTSYINAVPPTLGSLKQSHL